jgi:hypothetical protein
MIPLVMIVRRIFGNRLAEMALPVLCENSAEGRTRD